MSYKKYELIQAKAPTLPKDVVYLQWGNKYAAIGGVKSVEDFVKITAELVKNIAVG